MEFTTTKQELFNAFTNIYRNDNTHTYYVNDVKYPSSTTSIIGKFSETFNADLIAEYIAKRDNREKQEILNEWKEIKDEACGRGSLVHKCLEFAYGIPCEQVFDVLCEKLDDSEYRQLFNEKELKQ